MNDIDVLMRHSKYTCTYANMAHEFVVIVTRVVNFKYQLCLPYLQLLCNTRSIVSCYCCCILLLYIIMFINIT